MFLKEKWENMFNLGSDARNVSLYVVITHTQVGKVIYI